jgi:hypothetical protein
LSAFVFGQYQGRGGHRHILPGLKFCVQEACFGMHPLAVDSIEINFFANFEELKKISKWLQKMGAEKIVVLVL